MKLPKTYENTVHFAGFARVNRLDPRALAELCVLSWRAAHRQALEASHPNAAPAAPSMRRVEVHAAKMGLKTQWPGLYPTFHGAKGPSERIDTLPYC